jgi:hypothetical protein
MVVVHQQADGFSNGEFFSHLHLQADSGNFGDGRVVGVNFVAYYLY